MAERSRIVLAPLAMAAACWAFLAAEDAVGASFDCSQAKAAPEIAVCNNPELSALDDELGDIYQKTLAATKRLGARRRLEMQQAKFLQRNRDRCVNDVPCLRRAYEGRVAQLRQQAGLPAKPASRSKGQGTPPVQPWVALFAPVWDVPENPALPVAGFWLADVKCRKGNAEAVIFIVEGARSSRIEGFVKYYAPEMEQPHAAGFSLLVGERTNDGSYDFATDNRPSYSSSGASGQVLGGFNARVGGKGLEGRFLQGSCEHFSAVRLRPDSDYLRPTRADDATGGTFNQGDRCQAVLDWLTKLDGVFQTNTPLERVMPLAAMLYADDDFVPVFGIPYDRTTREWRTETGQWIHAECLGDRITRQKLINYSGFLQFSDLDHRETEPRVRQTRRLRHQLAGIGAALADANLDSAVRLADEARTLTQQFSFLLWPREIEDMTGTASNRLAVLARPEAEAILARLESPSVPSLDLLLAADGMLANFNSQTFSYLPADEREAKRERLRSRRSTIAAEVVNPIAAGAAATTADLDGVHAIDVLLEAQKAFLERLPADVQQSLYRDLRALQQKHLESDVAATIQTLDTSNSGKVALGASAAWKASFDRRYISFKGNPAVSAVEPLYLDHRKSLLLASVKEFENELAGTAADGPGAEQYPARLMQEYLAWGRDRSLPQSLEYLFALNQWAAAKATAKDEL